MSAGHSHGHGHSHEYDHSHNHAHNHAGTSTTSLVIALGVTTVIFLAEVIGGLVSGSLALLSDAAHMLSDSAGLIIALVASWVGKKKPNLRATFGYRRTEVLAALVNALFVSAVSAWIIVNAVHRFAGAEDIETETMMGVAVVGLVANAISALVLMKSQTESINVRGAYLHVLSDLFGSVAVIVTGCIIMLTGWVHADSVASIIIAMLILPQCWKLLVESVRILLNSTPVKVDTTAVLDRLSAVPHVQGVHDLHIWTTDGNDLLATCHLVVDSAEGHVHTPTVSTSANSWGERSNCSCTQSDCGVLDLAQSALKECGIEHSTIQLEITSHQEHEVVCALAENSQTA